MQISPSSFVERVIDVIRLDQATSQEVEQDTGVTWRAAVVDRQRRRLAASARGEHRPRGGHSGRGVPGQGRGASGYGNGIRHQFYGFRLPDTALDVMP